MASHVSLTYDGRSPFSICRKTLDNEPFSAYNVAIFGGVEDVGDEKPIIGIIGFMHVFIFYSNDF